VAALGDIEHAFAVGDSSSISTALRPGILFALIARFFPDRIVAGPRASL
jgi:hypothetical protein